MIVGIPSCIPRPEVTMRPDADSDPVTESSEESFPASDAPGWIGGSASPGSQATPPPTSPRLPVPVEGLIAGLLGYAAVVVTVAAMDLLAGRALFHTPAALGSWLFFWPGDVSGPAPRAGPLLTWNGVHLVLSLVVGTIGAFLVLESERLMGFWYFALMVLIATAVYAVVILGGVGTELAQVLDWPTILVGTVAWLGAMTLWFWKAHPGAAQRLQADLDSDG